MTELTFRVDDLASPEDRENVREMIYQTIRHAAQKPGCFEISIDGPTPVGDHSLYALDGRTHADGVTHLTESYYPADVKRDPTWMYTDMKPGYAPIERHYTFYPPKGPAGWVYSRLEGSGQQSASQPR